MYISLAKNHPFSPHADNALYWAGVTQFLYSDRPSGPSRRSGSLLKIPAPRHGAGLSSI